MTAKGARGGGAPALEAESTRARRVVKGGQVLSQPIVLVAARDSLADFVCVRRQGR